MVALSVVDIIMIVACSYLALFLRVMDDARELRLYLPGIHKYVLINVATTLVIFLVLNLYNRVWSYASAHEAISVAGYAVFLSDAAHHGAGDGAFEAARAEHHRDWRGRGRQHDYHGAEDEQVLEPEGGLRD